MSLQVLSWQTGSLLGHLACCGHHCKEVKGKVLARESMCAMSTLSTLRAETPPETGEGKRRERHLGSAQPREAHFVII